MNFSRICYFSWEKQGYELPFGPQRCFYFEWISYFSLFDVKVSFNYVDAVMSTFGGLRVGVSGIKQDNVILLIGHKTIKNSSQLGIYVIC